MARYRILSWHDIPSQIRVEDSSGRVNKQLPPRFQEAIDWLSEWYAQVTGESF